MRYLCLDLGDKRTGVAIGDAETGIVTPLRVVECAASNETELVRVLSGIVQDQKPGALVIGLPLNMDDSEGPQAKKVRVLGERLSNQLRLSLHFQDERLTSEAADWAMARVGFSRGEKKSRRDAIAAATILRDFLSTLSSRPE